MKIITPTQLRKNLYDTQKFVNENHDIIMIHNIRHDNQDTILIGKSDYDDLIKKISNLK